MESHHANRGLWWRASVAARRDQNSRPARLRSALLGTGNRSTTAPLKPTSESCESRCWPVETSSSPRGYRRVTSPIIRAMPVCIGGNSPVRRKVLATALSFPQESILKEHRRRTHPSVNHTEPSVQDAAVEDIITPKPEGRPQRHIAK